MTAILEALTKAIETGEVLRVRYLGGSHPGAVRDVQPILVRDDKVRAGAVPGGEVKTFFIDKMELVSADEKITQLPAAPLVYESPDAFLEHEQHALESLGWQVVHEGNTIKLDRPSVDSKGRPGTITEVTLNLEYGEYFDGEKMVQMGPGDRGRKVDFTVSVGPIAANGKPEVHTSVTTTAGEGERAWKLHINGRSTRAYGNFPKAQQHFMDFARDLAPNRITNSS